MGHVAGRRPGAARRVVKLGAREPRGSARGAASACRQRFSRREQQQRVLEARDPHRARRRPARVQDCRVNDRRIRPGDAHRAGCSAGRGDRTPPGAARIAVDRASADGQRAVGAGAVGAHDVRGRDVQTGHATGVEHLQRPRNEPEPGDSGSERHAVVDLRRRRTRRQVDEIFAASRESPMQDRPAHAEGAGIDHVPADCLSGHRQRPVQRDVDRGAARHVGQMEGCRAKLRQHQAGRLRFGGDRRRRELRAQRSGSARESLRDRGLYRRSGLCLDRGQDLSGARSGAREGRAAGLRRFAGSPLPRALARSRYDGEKCPQKSVENWRFAAITTRKRLGRNPWEDDRPVAPQH